MEKERSILKKLFLILCGISIILGGVIFILYKNDRNSKEEVVEIFTEEEKEEEIVLEDLDDVKEESKHNKIYVDIKGMVAAPGVYVVDDTYRVNDVINLAGGLIEGADTSTINLAKIVYDEMTIIIYSNEEIREKYKEEVCVCDCSYIVNDACINSDNNTNENELVNINTAGTEELMNISGIGESKAKEIINYREVNGNFNSIEDIMNVPGIGESLFEKIKVYITV